MISKVHIKNFRSIKDLTIEPKNLCALLGPNSTGKTNILKALDVLLGETWPSERSFTKDDFFQRDTDAEIFIQVWFEEPLERCRLTSCESRVKESCSPDSFIFKHTRRGDSSFGTQFLVIDDQGRQFYGGNEAREQVCFVYIPSDRNLEKQMTISQWTLLGKILRKIDGNFRKKPAGASMSEVEQQFREAMRTPKEILESEFVGDWNYKKFKEAFIEICQDNTRGLAQSFSLDLEIYDPLFYYKTIQIIGREEMGDFNVQELGSGVQNLVLLSLFRTYAKIMKNRAVFAIEEPEIYLYPQAQRQLYNSFARLSYPEDGTRGTQIFYTTHNPNFVDGRRADEVEMLFKDGGTGTYRLQKSNIVTREFLRAGQFKIYTHFNTERNELFFARKAVLVEGNSDKILFSTLCEEKWGIDLNKEGVSVIECGGKGGVMYFIGVCRLLGIENYFAVWDEDPGHPTGDEHGNFQHALDSGHGWQVTGNMETFLRTHFPTATFRDDRKVEDSFNWATGVAPEAIPTEFNVVHDFIATPNADEEEEQAMEPAISAPDIAHASDIRVEDLPF